MTILEHLKNHPLLFDGAMGTMLQKYGLPLGALPEYFNLSHPEIVQQIHTEYVAAGCDVVTTNTFQANGKKIKPEDVEEIIIKAVQLARAAQPKFVACDIGPIGQLLAPLGTLTFDEAYDLFKIQMIAAEQAGADLILIETMSDLLETKAAILAAKENTQLPIFATMTFQADGRTFLGTDPLTAVLTLQSLGVAAVGLNCSLGPAELLPHVETLLDYAQIPVIVQANAGLPEIVDGQTVYRITETEYAANVAKMLQKGVRIIGGCCGTTPAFIKELRHLLDTTSIKKTNPQTVTAVTSGTQTHILNDQLSVIGERLNPTGKKRLQAALRQNDFAYVLNEAITQQSAGADLLDVNVGLPELNEAQLLTHLIPELQSITSLPLVIDSSSPEAIEAAARIYNGRPLINSVNGKPETMAKIFPLVKKYGALVLGLALDETGIPETAETRCEVAATILQTAQSFGIPPADVLIDPLVLTASAQQDQVAVTLDTLKLIKKRLGLLTVAGVSNVSFGLPNRALLNSTFLAAAVGAGLDAPIINPASPIMSNAIHALRVINGQDHDATNFIANNQAITITKKASAQVLTPSDETDLKTLIIQGRKDETAPVTRELLEVNTPLEIVDQFFIPALNLVGEEFDQGRLFLPQLMQSANAVKQAQDVLKDYFATQPAAKTTSHKILLATVEGDIHDIGKNIVKMLLENYGFDVVDLGKDVPIETVVATITQQQIKLVGLSALMTTTVQSMKKTIAACKAAELNVTFMVGGAVLNEDYREFVGADFYAHDALESVTIAQRFFADQN
ncbi:homocysteine S-methyltransferase family protein [Enterococcus sp. CSURQ0835]|uniref:homocysteine S-methyltransferase family protein n=1 Tax=Enterococcus sp. CSURQ0835 TaxID=2681394 RepID=UPI00135AB74F|nr:homocysteine S-methyltransferase family protein [Enterococcus sp. CSURQ0835]